jgi:hypothetical protein
MLFINHVLKFKCPTHCGRMEVNCVNSFAELENRSRKKEKREGGVITSIL